MFVAAGEYHENLVITDDTRIQATKSSTGKVIMKHVTDKVDEPVIEIKVRAESQSCHRTQLSILLLYVNGKKQSGSVHFTGINIVHDCKGQDLWNGNSAVMIQGAAGEDGRCQSSEAFEVFAVTPQ